MIKNPEISPEIISEHGLTSDEYEKIISILNREPSYVELGIFSVILLFWFGKCVKTE